MCSPSPNKHLVLMCVEGGWWIRGGSPTKTSMTYACVRGSAVSQCSERLCGVGGQSFEFQQASHTLKPSTVSQKPPFPVSHSFLISSPAGADQPGICV